MPHILCNLYSLAFTEYRGELTGRHLSFTESAMNQLCQRNYVDTILVFNQTDRKALLPSKQRNL